MVEMTDTERLNKLESFMRKSSSNGIAMMPLNGGRLFSIDDLAHEDGSNLGEEYCIGETLRDAIAELGRCLLTIRAVVQRITKKKHNNCFNKQMLD